MLPLKSDESVYWVSLNDVATAVATLLDTSSFQNKKVYELYGPQPLSGEEMAVALSTALLDEVKFEALSPEIAEGRVSALPNWECQLYMGRKDESRLKITRSKAQLLALSDADVIPSDLTELGNKPTFFHEWAKRKYPATAQGYESDSLASLAARGGVRALVSDALLGNREVHTEIDPSMLELGEQIGEGAAGRVFRGTYMGMPVAIKKLTCDFVSFSLAEFKLEIGVISLLHHPNLIQLIGACTKSPELLYLVFELFPRGRLAHSTTYCIAVHCCCPVCNATPAQFGQVSCLCHRAAAVPCAAQICIKPREGATLPPQCRRAAPRPEMFQRADYRGVATEDN
eukprot:TRINITY_DN4676_c0_g1_i7.p1 TRINITY_DN4676_c0_g1~~TRINITY_DN4676_c0_g1_i7.p1  ORF type:complete len:343 (-),score=67.37 TRINITY_DN4676_c0_g1_i7:752-1780(-)